MMDFDRMLNLPHDHYKEKTMLEGLAHADKNRL
jgi:hypothetical protein